MEQSGSNSHHSERIPIYTPGNESSFSSFSGFSETLVNPARAIASPPRFNPRLNTIPLFDFYNTPNSKSYYLRPPLSRIPRPTTPTSSTSPSTALNPLLPLLYHKEYRFATHQSHLCCIPQTLLPLFEITLSPLLFFVTLIPLPPHPLLRSPPQLPLIVVILVYNSNRAVHPFLLPNHGKNTLFRLIFYTIFSMI